MRLIDVDAPRKTLVDWLNWYKGPEAVRSIVRETVDILDETPTVDAEPVRHGEWVLTKLDATYSFFKCSECGRPVRCGNANFMKPSKHVDAHYPYCHCGAKMDGGKLAY